jgi:hypothetical protein
MQLPDTGDVLFTRGPSFFNRLTCKLTGPAAHQATFYDSGHIVEASAQSGMIEKVECNQTFEDLNKRKAEWIIFHWNRPEMTPALRSRVQCDLLEATAFERYSYIELPLLAMDTILNRYIMRRPLQGLDAQVFRKLGNIWDNGVICSKTSNQALIKNGFIPDCSRLEYGSPSDTYRYLKSIVKITGGQKIASILDYSKGWFNFNGA